ncbi:MAG: insulinase family protein [Spirochaetaceae bacterium]|jgi:zinc protease|nr:insulinase family protein [Spirochaetaceae bacterium]
MIKKYWYALIITALVMANCARNANIYRELGSADTPIPLYSEVRTGMLVSGLKYYILENKKPENRAYITLAVNTGSVQEDDDEQGLAHFVEHMAFAGTERFPGDEVVEYLRTLGMRFGADVNAYTSFDNTVYGIEVPVTVDEAGGKTLPPRALAIIDDWTHAVAFTEKDTDEERSVIMEEYRARLGSSERASRELLKELFAGSKYAERRPIGLPEIFETAPAEKLKEFYRKWYRADNMALIFVGDFDGAALEADLENHFSIHAPEAPLKLPAYDLPAPKKGTVNAHIFTDSEITTTYISLYYKQRWIPAGTTLKDFRAAIIDNLIDSIISERWTDMEHQPETPFFSAYSGKMRAVARSRHVALGAAVKAGRFNDAFAALLREKERFVRYGFLEGELERAKTALISNMETALAEKEKRNSERYVTVLTELFLKNEDFPGIEWELNAAQLLLDGITVRDLNRMIKDYFIDDDLLVFITANSAEQDALPSQDELVSMVRTSKKEKLEKPVEDALSSDLLPEMPRQGSISSEDRDEATETLMWTLSNGVKVLIKPTQNQNDEIILNAVARGGISSSPQDTLISARLAAELAAASGLGNWKLPDLAKKLAGKQVSLSFSTSTFTRSIEGRSTAGDLPTLFELLYLGFTAPRHDEDTAAILKEEYLTLLAQRQENPEAYFNDELIRLVYNNNPYYKPLETADIATFDISAAAAWTRRSRNPADYTFVFAGNADPAVIRPLIETYLASIPPRMAFNMWDDPKISFPQTVDKSWQKGKEDKSIVYLGHIAQKSWSLAEAMTAEMLGEYLDITLTQEIREKLGGVYSVSPEAGLSPTPPPGELALQVYFACAPGRVEELTNAIEAEFAKIAGGIINGGTLSKARSALIKNWEKSMESNSYIARRYASYSTIFNIPLNTLSQRPALYEAVTPEAMQTMTRELLRHGLIRAVLYPAPAAN